MAHQIKILGVRTISKYDTLKEANGIVNGRRFKATQYRDHHALRGAQPARWRVSTDGVATFGERIAVAKALSGR